MGGVTGRQVGMAFAKFGTNSWGVAASVTKGAYFSSDGGLRFQPSIIDDEAYGQVFLAESEVGDVEPQDLSLPAVARFDDTLYVFDALCMGSPATPTLSTSATGQVTSWKHIIDLADTIDGLGITMATSKQLYVEELTSAKVYGFEEGDADGGKVTATYKVLGTKPIITSSININSTVAGASYPSLGNRVMRKHATLRMNKAVGSSLAAVDVVKFESLKISYTRPQDRVHIGGQDFIDEPADNGFPEITVEINYPRMNSTSANSLFAGLRDGTTFKADLTYAGALINSTDAYSRKFEFPALKLQSHETPLAGANQIKPKALFKAYLATTTPTNMALIRPMRLTRIMVNSVIAF
jgi:hypothetical protein